MKWLQLPLHLVSLPFDLVSWSLVLLIRGMWGDRLEWENPRAQGRPGLPALTCEFREGSWPVTEGKGLKGFYLHKLKDGRIAPWGGTTFFHGIVYGPNRRPPKGDKWAPIQVHEHTHCEQLEAFAVLALYEFGLHFLLSWMGQSTAGQSLMMFLALPLLGMAANWTTAFLRGEDAYRGSHHEEAAYAADDLYERGVE